ncbi:MAG TPA: HEAT repeat domain-containing protein, partial [Anaerolineales bacterium]
MPLTTEQAVSTFDQLLAALQHPNPNVRAGAAIVLGKTKSARAVEPLTDLLEDPVYLVYTGAAKALGMIGSLAVGSLLAVIQEPPSLDSASRAYEALRAVRDSQATGLLMAAASYDEPLIRWGAIEALGNMHTEQALPALIDAARHPDERTRQHAVSALGNIAHPDGIQAIAALLNETDWQMRVTAVEALERIGSERVVLPLLAAMRDPTMQVREAAAQALQSLRDPQAAEILLAAFNGADAWTRQYLARALGEIGEPRAAPILESLALDDDDVQVRLSAAQSLAKMNHPRGEAVILRTLNAPNAQTRTLAAIALGNTGSPRAVTPLLEFNSAQRQNGPEFLKAIVSSLRCVGEPAVPALIEALGSPEHEKIETAFKALRQLGQAAVPALLEAMPTAESPRVCQQLIRLLGMAGDARAVEPLAEVLRGGAMSGFSLRVLFDPTVDERKLAADALANIGTPACAVPLLSAARYDLDREVRERAARALAAIGDAESILQLAQPQVFGEVSRSFVSVLVLLVTGFVTGALAALVGSGRAGLLAGMVAGALVGVVDGLTGQKQPVRGALVGAGLAAVWGVFALLFNGSPPLPELVSFPLVRV